MLSYLEACIYYLLLFLYGYLYNTIAFFIYCVQKIFKWKRYCRATHMLHRRYYDDIEYYYANAYLLILKLLGVRIYLSGESIRSDRILWICNHRSYLDPPILKSIICTKNNPVITIAKYSLKYIPVLGSIGKHCKVTYLNKYISETILMNAGLRSIRRNASMLIFPEGATLCPKNKFKSDQYALNNGLSLTKNVMIPKVRGFSILKRYGRFDIIGNMTIYYDGLNGYDEHGIMALFKKFPKEIYIQISYDKIDSDQLVAEFNKKDKIIENKEIIKRDKLVKLAIWPMLYNILIFVVFYYACYNVKYFFYASLALNLVSYGKMLWLK